ncbi:hypothetical protein PCANC_27327 [Puccinia coronata f. sp. avenae]|uniref:Reverse transcriptase RNase H-like domain-containing protein n=1 Tax=Puccinia coronata f. sp. avenae TaxID=200324 RepID=A0A2N5S803_9BASI|nr:hypothetical protein PCANC_27327 [Puccinia coronata f. sp. avenae]
MTSCVSDRNPNWVTAEKKALADYCDLFPANIPAVSEEAEAEGLIRDGSFPEKLQNKSSHQRNLSRRQARWTEILADFNLNFKYIRGEDNSIANAL